MKTTVNLNLQGIVFHMEENAFRTFTAYLDSIHRHFKESRGRDDIINDIEIRIVELFQQRLASNKQVISLEDVEAVKVIMGSTSDFEEEFRGTPVHQPMHKKRLYRDMENRMVGGVCSGLGAYFNFDPTWFRLAFVVATLSGLSPLVYVILWIVVPPARTIAEKLEMYGEPVNISNIEKAIMDEMDGLRNKFGEYTGKARSRFKRRR